MAEAGVGRGVTDGEVDEKLSGLLDGGGERLPLLTLGEARAIRFVAHLLAQGDGPGSMPAAELVSRLDRRLLFMYPDADICIGAEVSA